MLHYPDQSKSFQTLKRREAPLHSVCGKRKRPRSLLNVALINAGNDLRSHTLGACSTIGPAGLNFRVRDGNGWNPRGKITDNLRRLAGVNEPLKAGLGACCRSPEPTFYAGEGSPDAISVSEHLICNQTLRRIFKDREARYLTTE
jgi:hypothetical protein